MRILDVFLLSLVAGGCANVQGGDVQATQQEKREPKYLSMKGLSNPLPKYHDQFKRMVFGNVTDVHKDGLVYRRDQEVDLKPAGEWVVGFPWLLNLRVRNLAGGAFWVPVVNLATSAELTTDVEFFVVPEQGASYAFWRRGGDSLRARKNGGQFVRHQPNALSSMWFDLIQLMTSDCHQTFSWHSEQDDDELKAMLEPVDVGRLVHPGRVWMVMSFGRTATETPAEISVRLPNRQERAFLEDIGFGGDVRSWFPDVLSIQTSFPPADHLPLATRRVIRLVEVLSAAVHSSSEGVALLQSNTGFDWGPLEDLIHQVEYECLIDLSREQEGRVVEGRLNRGTAAKIRNGRGVVAAYRMFYLSE